MAAVEVTITGTLYDKLSRTTQQVVLIGEASLTGVGIGGGPIQPPAGGPPGIWGPTDPRPTPPINLPPGYPGQPPGIWPNPPEGQAPIPGHPIVLPPDEGTKPPEPIAPPVAWKPVWHPTEGWIAVGIINPDIPHPTPS